MIALSRLVSVGRIAVAYLGVSRKHLSYVVNGRAGGSPEMTARLDKAFGGGAHTFSTDFRWLLTLLIPIQCDVTMFCRANLYGFPLSRE